MSTVPPANAPTAPADKKFYVAPPPGPVPATSRWATRWPGPGRAAAPATIFGIAAGAIVAALSLPLDRSGVGWLITAIAGAAALVVVKAIGDRPAPNIPPPLVTHPAARPDWDRYGWSAATVALLAVGTFRAAGWLFLLCLVTATLTGALALIGGRSTRGIAAGYTMAPVAALRSAPWLAGGIARMRLGKRDGGVRIWATVAVSIALLTVFGALFASADAAFSDALATATPDVDAGTVARWIFVLAAAGLLLGGAAFLRAAPPDLSGMAVTEGRKVDRLEWAIPLGLLVLLFAGFVAVQITVLFGGNRHVLDTDGLTYADYARGGFWQLSFVTGLTLLVLAGAARWAPRATPADRVVFRSVLGPLAGLTLVIVASALLRILVYTETYGLTRMRLLVASCEGWFGLVLVMVLIAGIGNRAPWLPRVAIAAAVLALLGLAGANPDGLIAQYNIKQDRTIDLTYLGTLSPDAAPALAGLPPSERACVLGLIAARLDERRDDWRGWNLGRARARQVVTEHDAVPVYYCS